MCASRRKIAAPSGVSYDRTPSNTPVPYWRACALTCTCAESHGSISPFIHTNSVFVNPAMRSPRVVVGSSERSLLRRRPFFSLCPYAESVWMTWRSSTSRQYRHQRFGKRTQTDERTPTEALPSNHPNSQTTRSDVTDLVRLLHRGDRVALGDELLADEAGESGIGDRLHDSMVVQLLRLVDLVATGHATSVEMGDVLDVRANRADHVAFHDLHVIDVVEQLDARRSDALHDLHAERRVIGLIVVMIDFAVEELEAECHTVLFGRRRQALEPRDAVGDAFTVGEPGTIAAEHDDVRHARRGGERDHAVGVGHELVVILDAVESHRDRAETVRHRADETVLLGHGPLVLAEQIDAVVPDALGRLAQLVERDLPVAPARHRVLEAQRRARWCLCRFGGGRV